MYCFVEKLVDEMIEFNIVEQCQKEEYVYSILCIAESIIWFVTIICIGIPYIVANCWISGIFVYFEKADRRLSFITFYILL